MKKTTRKFALGAAIAALVFCGSCSAGYLYENVKIERQERAYLLDFIKYCQKNEGLRQIDPGKDYTKSSTHDLKKLAKFYLDQDNFLDVSDYWDVSVIDNIIYNNACVRTCDPKEYKVTIKYLDKTDGWY